MKFKLKDFNYNLLLQKSLPLDKMNRWDVVPYYINLVKSADMSFAYLDEVKEINKIIIKRWSKNGLVFIKDNAWRCLEKHSENCNGVLKLENGKNCPGCRGCMYIRGKYNRSKLIETNNKINTGIQLLSEALLADKEYWHTWKSGIAMCYIDAEKRYREGRNIKFLTLEMKSIIANDAAELFLKLLTHK